MNVIANDNYTFKGYKDGKVSKVFIRKDDSYNVEWYTESIASEADSYFHIFKYKEYQDNVDYDIPCISYDLFKSYFTPVENHKTLHLKRFKGKPEELEYSVNKFLKDTNFTIEKIFEPDSSVIDIYYTKYKGEW